MSYTGSFTIIDEDGHAVFEQELTQDQIIQTLIASHSYEEGEEVETPRTEPKAKKEPKPSDFERYIPGGNRPCGCGPTGRHRKKCKLAGSSVKPAPKPTSDRKPFSESTYDKVRSKLEKSNEWEVVTDMGLDAGEVSRIAESESYEDYTNG